MTATLPDLAFEPTLLPRPITVRTAPRREPPFDDEIAPGRDGQPPQRSWVLIGAQPLPFEPAPAPAVVRGHHRSWALGSTAATANSDAAELPDPAGWSRRLFVALLETRVGLRPLRQLNGYLSPAVSAGLAAELARDHARDRARSASHAGRPRAATVTSIHVCEPADRVAEVSAVICAGTRYRAIAARLEGQDGRWRCVRLQFG